MRPARPTSNLLILSLACFITAYASFVLALSYPEVYSAVMLASAFFAILGIATFGVYYVDRVRKKNSTLFKNT